MLSIIFVRMIVFFYHRYYYTGIKILYFYKGEMVMKEWKNAEVVELDVADTSCWTCWPRPCTCNEIKIPTETPNDPPVVDLKS